MSTYYRFEDFLKALGYKSKLDINFIIDNLPESEFYRKDLSKAVRDSGYEMLLSDIEYINRLTLRRIDIDLKKNSLENVEENPLSSFKATFPFVIQFQNEVAVAVADTIYSSYRPYLGNELFGFIDGDVLKDVKSIKLINALIYALNFTPFEMLPYLKGKRTVSHCMSLISS